MVLLSTGYDQNAVESQLILLDICIAQQRHLYCQILMPKKRKEIDRKPEFSP